MAGISTASSFNVFCQLLPNFHSNTFYFLTISVRQGLNCHLSFVHPFQPIDLILTDDNDSTSSRDCYLLLILKSSRILMPSQPMGENDRNEIVFFFRS